MLKYLKIANIYIKFQYTFNDFFAEKINAYETHDLNHEFVDFTVMVQEDIQAPNREITFTYKNRFKMETDQDCYLLTKEKDKIKHLIYYSKGYKQVKIILNQYLKDKLPELEYILSGMYFFEIAISQGYLPIHASALHHKGQTFLLSGPSKSGKSTHTNLFLEEYPNTIIINEDKPIIFLKENQLFISGSPWSGKHVINKNLTYPLDYIFFIKQADKLSIESLDGFDKVKELFRNIHRPGDESLMNQSINIVNEIIKNIPLYRFKTINNKSSSIYLNQFLEDSHEN